MTDFDGDGNADRMNPIGQRGDTQDGLINQPTIIDGRVCTTESDGDIKCEGFNDQIQGGGTRVGWRELL
jgi:hypothetical protein